MTLTNELKQNFLCDLEKLIEYLAFVGSSSKTNISFFLLSICTDEPLCTPKIIKFLPQLKPEHEKVNDNQIPYHIPNKNVYLDQHFL